MKVHKTYKTLFYQILQCRCWNQMWGADDLDPNVPLLHLEVWFVLFIHSFMFVWLSWAVATRSGKKMFKRGSSMANQSMHLRTAQPLKESLALVRSRYAPWARLWQRLRFCLTPCFACTSFSLWFQLGEWKETDEADARRSKKSRSVLTSVVTWESHVVTTFREVC